MNKYEIIKKIEQFAPIESAEVWDCVGFMVETDKQEISKVMLCLTPTQKIIDQAKSQNCDMIIAHHPLFFVPTEWRNIDIYSAHTNLDKAIGGTTDTLIKVLGFENYKINIDHEFLRMIEFETPMNVEIFSKKISEISQNARIVNNNDVKTIKRVAFCAGSGSEFTEIAQEMGSDALVTGDLKFHQSLETQIIVYDVGHFESEILILPELKKLLPKGLEVVYAQENSPFKNIK